MQTIINEWFDYNLNVIIKYYHYGLDKRFTTQTEHH